MQAHLKTLISVKFGEKKPYCSAKNEGGLAGLLLPSGMKWYSRFYPIKLFSI